MKDLKIICLDYDGTCLEDTFKGGMDEDLYMKPQPNYIVIEEAKKRAKEGWSILLWTCRTGKYLDEAVAFCEKHEIPLTAINEHHPRILEICKEKGLTPSRKLFAHEYWDDKGKSIPEICKGVERCLAV